MKNLNRVRLKGGKNRRSAQLRKTTESQSAKAESSPPINPDAAQYLQLAILRVLQSNTTAHGPTAEIITEFLPQFGFTVTADQVQPVLEMLEQTGAAYHVGAFWFHGKQLDMRSLLDLLQPSKTETAYQKVSSLLELLRCKVIADMEDVIYRESPNYDPLKTQRLCGLQDLICDAKEALDNAYTASDTFAKELRRLAGQPV